MSVELNTTYGRLYTISRLPTSNRRSWWLCHCACGSMFVRVRGDLLTTGNTTSCGCRRLRSMGLSNSPTYKTWAAMRRRCSDVSHPRYDDYGGRGIAVCDRWNDSRTGFAAFVEDVGLRPPNMTLDRKDVNGNYEPNNVKWATIFEQRWNRRDFTKRRTSEDRSERAHWDEVERLQDGDGV